MRTFIKTIIASAAIAALATPVHVQAQDFHGSSGGGRIGPPPSGLKPEDRVNEKDYKAAVDRLPAPVEKPDPWKVVREKPQTK